MGLGAEGRLPRRAARLAAAQGVTEVLFVQGLKFWKAEPTPAGLTALSVQSMQAIADHARTRLGAIKLHGIGESQAAPAVLEAAIEDPDALDGSIVLLHPIGMTALSRMTFLSGMTRSGLQRDQRLHVPPSLTIKGSLHLAKDAVRTGDRRLAQLDFALSYRGAPRLQTLREQQPERRAVVMAAAEDLTFPPVTQFNSLAAEDCQDMLYVIPSASHSTPASPAGAKQVVESVYMWYANMTRSYDEWNAIQAEMLQT